MARKRTKKPTKYTIQHGKLQHQTSARRFAVWLRAGWLVLVNPHRAHVSDLARTVWEDGELFLKPVEAPGVSLRTNAQTLDECYPLAHAGQIPVSRDQRQAFTAWRQRFGETAEQMISEYLSREREFAVRAQYGW